MAKSHVTGREVVLNSSLDPLMQQEVLDLIQGARDECATVFFSSHIMREVQAVAGRVAMIRQGERASMVWAADAARGIAVSSKMPRIMTSFQISAIALVFVGTCANTWSVFRVAHLASGKIGHPGDL
jgi:ABC-type sugar transport system ATPase subunit